MRLSVHVAPHLRSVGRTHPTLVHLHRILRDEHGLSDRRASAFVERLLLHVVDDFGDRYLGEMSARLRRIGNLRSELAGALDQVVAGGGLPGDMSVQRMNSLFDDLQTEIAALRSPTQHAETTPLVDNPTAHAAGEWADFNHPPDSAAAPSAPRAAGAHTEVPGPIRAKFESFSPDDRALLRSAANEAPGELWRAIEAETESGQATRMRHLADRMREAGMNEPDIARLLDTARDLGLERARSQRTPHSAEGRTRAHAVASLPDADLRAAVGGDRYLETLAHSSPQMIQALWIAFKDTGGGNRAAFRQYVRRRMVTHVRGLVGEFTAAFHLGDDLVLLKGPDYDVTIPGTDLVGVSRGGDVWLIDNKAVGEPTLRSVTALVENLPKNIADDASAFIAGLHGRTGVEPRIADAVRRLDAAAAEIRIITSGMDAQQVRAPDVQARIQAVLDAHHIRRVITTAGGKITGLSEGLSDIGIQLHAPAAAAALPPAAMPVVPGTAAAHVPVAVPNPTGATSLNPVLRDSAGRLQPGGFWRGGDGAVHICNEVGPSQPRQNTEAAMFPGVEVGLDGWHRAQSQGAGLMAESPHGVLYAPPEVKLSLQNSRIEQFIRDVHGQLAPGVRLILTTETSVHAGTRRLSEIIYLLEAERGGRRSLLYEVNLTVDNVHDNPRTTISVQPYLSVEEFLRP